MQKALNFVKKSYPVVFIVAFAVVGTVYLVLSHAETSCEPTSGAVSVVSEPVTSPVSGEECQAVSTAISAPASSVPISVDINGDGRVDILDLSHLLSHWNKATTSSDDLDRNGRVDIIDLSILLSSYAK